MATVSLKGNDGQLVINNLPLNTVSTVTVKAETMVAGGMSNSAILSKVAKYQTVQAVNHSVSNQVISSKVAKILNVPTPQVPALKGMTPLGLAIKPKRAKGDNNPKRARALVMFKEMTEQGLNQEKMLKAVQDELGITYANTYYYYGRVFLAKKA